VDWGTDQEVEDLSGVTGLDVLVVSIYFGPHLLQDTAPDGTVNVLDSEDHMVSVVSCEREIIVNGDDGLDALNVDFGGEDSI
jgi:hypothetical protein